MNQDTVVGTAKNLGGKVQQGVARVTDDVKSQAAGVANQAAGAAQDLYGQAKEGAQDLYAQAKEGAQDAAKAAQQSAVDMEDYIRHVIEKRPYTTAIVALCVGVVLGRMGRN